MKINRIQSADEYARRGQRNRTKIYPLLSLVSLVVFFAVLKSTDGEIFDRFVKAGLYSTAAFFMMEFACRVLFALFDRRLRPRSDPGRRPGE
jgi:hypothetical protein